MKFSTWLAALFMTVGLSVTRADEEPAPSKPESHTTRELEGWTVHVDDRLLSGAGQELGDRSLRLLANRLYDIKLVVPADRAVRLQKVPIWLDRTHGQLHRAQYHPSAGWLKANGYEAALAKCVHIPDCAEFVSLNHQRVQPWSVLHELAHAYHDQVLDFGHADIKTAWEKFRDSGKYQSVLHIDGRMTRHYALTDQKEFFAEMTESYFGVNDFFPFNRAELQRAEPELFVLLGNIWGVRPATGVKRAALSPATAAITKANSPELKRSEHWSFQALKPPALPGIRPAGTAVRNPIDQFIVARLESSSLHLSAEADRPTLIRRLSFDLLGLPPSPGEIDAFIADHPPGAYERLVERMLASPRYGERWGRHWLDVVRYTESQGFEYDKLRDHAWPYRDYVIKSFNDDKPYDRFMKEQIAGDVLEPITVEGMVGASLLVCGAWDEAGNSQANATQKAVTREEEMEDLVSVVGQTFLGLTVNCARCHAHKFDPIPQEDYYRIKSIFEGVKHGERPMASPAETAAHQERKESLKKRIAEAESRLAVLEAEGRNIAAGKQRAGTNQPGPTALARWTFDGTTILGPPGELKGGATIEKGRLRLAQEGAFYQSAPLQRDLHEKTLEAWVALADLKQGGGAAISIENDDGQVFDAIVFAERQPRKWMVGSSGFARTQDLDGPEENAAPGTLVHLALVFRADNRVALYRNGEPYGRPYTPPGPLPTYAAGKAHVLLGLRHKGGSRPWLTGDIHQAALYDRALSDGEVASAFRASDLFISQADILASLSLAQRAEREDMLAQIKRERAALEKIKPLPVTYAGARVQPPPTRLLKRGDVTSPGEVVSPAGLSAVVDLDREFGLAADAPEAQRRLKFAEWLADPRNPLPARVMANRIWHFHFGQGLVTTPNDFGASGARPSHPELLEWLATRLIASGWSVKALHRLIVNSATYRQSSRFDAKAAAIDADHQLVWRFPPRRLEAEALRDAMLAVSSQIDFQMGGPSFRSFDALKFPANAYVSADKIGPEFNRRTVYRMNVNSGKEPLLDAFDCPDPSVKTPRRGVTTTPLQALALMNNSFVRRQAEYLAERARTESGQDLRRALQMAYLLTLGRSATADEEASALTAAQERSLANVCWALLNSTEFIYVR